MSFMTINKKERLVSSNVNLHDRFEKRDESYRTELKLVNRK